MTVSAWNNGAFNRSGAGYGLRVSKADRDSVFSRSWNQIVIELPSAEPGQAVVVRLSPSFWRSCSELRRAEIGRWLIGCGYVIWQKSQSSTFRFESFGRNKFVLRVL